MDLVVAVGGGGQHVALAIARLVRLGALEAPVELFCIDADSDSRLALRLRTFGGTCAPELPHPLAGAERMVPPFARDLAEDTHFRRLFLSAASGPTERELFELFYDEASGGKDQGFVGVDIARGMYGNPSVGSAVFAAEAEALLQQLLPRAHVARRIFVTASFLGGTGAGITHQLVRLLRRKLEGRAVGLFGSFLLRWFDLPSGTRMVDHGTLLASMGHGLSYFDTHTHAWLDASLLLGAPDKPRHRALRIVQASPENDEAVSLYPLLAASAMVQLPERVQTDAPRGQVYGLAFDEQNPYSVLGQAWNLPKDSLDASLSARLIEALVLRECVRQFRARERHFVQSDYPEGSKTWGKSLAQQAKKLGLAPAPYFKALLEALEQRMQQLAFAYEWVEKIFEGPVDGLGAKDPVLRAVHERLRARRFEAPEAFALLAKAHARMDFPTTDLPPTKAAARLEDALRSALRH